MTPVILTIREWRERRGMTQADLAERVGVRQATISDLETGQSRRIELDLLDRLAKVLRCQPEALIKREARPKQQ